MADDHQPAGPPGERWVDVAHEALIRNWPRLRQWIDDDRAGLRLHRRITEGAREWLAAQRDDNLLFRGTRLAEALDWRTDHEAELNPDERSFVDASLALREREAQAARDQARRELDTARQLAAAETRRAEAAQALVQTERKARRRQRLFAIGLGLLAAAALVVAWIAETQRRRADTQQRLAVARQLDTAARTTDTASALGLALATLLSIESLRSAETDEALNQLKANLALLPQPADRRWQAHSGAVTSVAFSDNGRWLATLGRDGKLRTWDAAAAIAGAAEPKPLASLDAPAQDRTALAFSPDGRWLAGDCGRAACVWRTSDWGLQKRLPGGETMWGIAFSADSRRMAATGYHQPDAKVYDTGNDWAELKLPAPPELPGKAAGVAFSPDGRWLLTGGWAPRIVQRPIAGAAADFVGDAGQGAAWRLAYSPDRRRLAAADDNGSVTLYRVAVAGDGQVELAAPTRLVAEAGLSGLLGVGFSSDGLFLATGGGVWALGGAAAVQRVREVEAPTALAFHPKSAWLASGLRDGSVELRSRFDGGIDVRRFDHGGEVNDIQFSRDGVWLATASEDGFARVFEVESGRRLAALQQDGPAKRVVLAADRRWLAVASRNSVRVHEPATAWAERLRSDASGGVHGVAFSADQRWLVVAGSADGDSRHDRLQRYDTADWAAPPFRVEVDGTVQRVAFSPDGKHFAVRTQRRCARGMADEPGSTTVWPMAGGAVLASQADLTAQRLEFPCRGRDAAASAPAAAASGSALVEQARGWPSLALDERPRDDAATSPDGRWIARARVRTDGWSDHSVRLEPTRAADIVALACRRLPAAVAAIGEADWKRFMPHQPQMRPTCPVAPVAR